MSANTSDLFDIVHTMRAMRRLKPDPVPDALIRKILEAGVCRPERRQHAALALPGHQGPARSSRQVQVFYKRAFDEVVGPRYAGSAPPPGVTREALPPPARGRGVSDRSFPRGAGLDRRVPGGGTARRPAGPARRSIRPCRTCCWRLGRSGWARR